MTGGSAGVAPYVLLRFNPVPFPAADASHHAVLDRIAAGRRERAALRDAVLKALYELAPRAADEDRLRVVLPFSRAVHNDRAPKPALADLAAAGADAATLAVATAWLESLLAEHPLLAELELAVEQALAADRRRLQAVLGAPDFLKAAAITSPTLAAGAERYAGTPPATHDKRNRKAEPKLARYAERAVAKTSPFSHYTVVGRGTWGDGDRTGGRADQGGRAVRTEPSLLFVLRLHDAALRVPEVAAGLRYRVTDAARRTGTGFEFELMRDDPASARIYRTVRTKVAIPATRATELLVRRLAAEPDGLTVADIVRALSEAADPPLDPAPIRAFVEKLRAAGFLVPVLVPPQQGPAPALQLAAALDAVPGAEVATLARQLHELHAATAAISELDGPRRPAALAALSRAWSEAFAHWGATVPGGSPLFEDVAAADPVVVDRSRWSTVCGDLLALLPALEPFSLDHAAATLTTLSVVDKIGIGGRLPYLDFAALLREVFTPDRISLAAILDEIGGRGEAVRGLLDLREEFLRPVREGSDAAEVELGEDAVARVVAATPATLRRPVTSVSAFLQPVAQAESGTLTGAVLNSLLDGNGQFVSRFLPLWPEDDTAHVRAHLRETLPPGATELRAVQGFNANIHPRLLDREFRCDGVPADDDGLDAERLADLRDLDVVHDPALDRLVLQDHRGNRVNPFYLGFLVPYFLPWEQTGLYLLSQPTQFRLDAATELENRLAAEDRNRIRHYPRLRYRSVILGRERWYVPAALFPSQQPGESLAAFLVRLDAWRAEHGIPAHVFLARIGAADEEDAPGVAANAMGQPKPMYADLRSPLHARSLPAWLEDAPTVRVEEALPDPAAPASPDPHVGGSVVEYLIEHVVVREEER